MLFSIMSLNALEGRPPLQPSLPVFLSQSTSSCSLKETNFFVLRKFTPSMFATVENAQHEPQVFWSFTGFTAPWSTQSSAVGRSDVSRVGAKLTSSRRCGLKPLRAPNSSGVQSAKGVR